MKDLAKLQSAYWKPMFLALRAGFQLDEMELEDIISNTFIAFMKMS